MFDKIGWTEEEYKAALVKVKQPYYDVQIAEICKWLKVHGMRMRVKLDGSILLQKTTDPWD